MSFGKACAAVPAFAVVAGGQCGPPCGGLAGLGANLARRGRFRGRWRRCRLRLVLYLGRVPWRALAARLRALWRGGWCWSVLAPCVALGGRRVAGAGVVLIGCAWSLPPLRFGPLQPPPLRLLVHLSSAPAAVALVVAVVALRWWRGQIVNELARLALLALPLVWWPWRESNPRRRCGALQWSRPWPLRAVVLSLLYWRCTP